MNQDAMPQTGAPVAVAEAVADAFPAPGADLPVGCPIETTMTMVGSRTSMLLMREAFGGARRFDDFVARLGIAPATAASHLRGLVTAGLLERRPYREPGARARDEYRLTAAGLDFAPVLAALYTWGVAHAGIRPGLDVLHECGEPVRAALVCADGHAVDPAQISLARPPRH